MIEYLNSGSSKDESVNRSMRLLNDDINTSLETLKVIPNYESEEQVYDAVREGVYTYLENGIDYHSFINTLAFIKKHLLLLEQNRSEGYIEGICIELVKTFGKLHLNPQKKIRDLIRRKQIVHYASIYTPYLLGFVIGVGVGAAVY
jgi:hypothetical protein